MALSQGLEVHPFEGGMLLCDLANQRLLAFNATTWDLWPKLQAGRAPRQIAIWLAKRYDLDSADTQRDIDCLVAELARLGIWESPGNCPSPQDAVPESFNAESVPTSQAPVARLWCQIAGRIFQIDAERGALDHITLLLHGRIVNGEASDHAIRATGSLSECSVSLDGRSAVFARSPEEIIGAIFTLIFEALHPGVERLAFIHGASVARDDAAIILAAPSGSGKSTLLTALLCQNYDYLSDDMCCVGVEGHLVWPFPMGINLKRGSRGIVGIPAGFDAVEISGVPRRDRVLIPPASSWERPPATLRAVFFPQYVGEGEVRLERLSILDALQHLLSDRVHIGQPFTRTRVSNFLQWVESTPFYSLTYGSLEDATAVIAKTFP